MDGLNLDQLDQFIDLVESNQINPATESVGRHINDAISTIGQRCASIMTNMNKTTDRTERLSNAIELGIAQAYQNFCYGLKNSWDASNRKDAAGYEAVVSAVTTNFDKIMTKLYWREKGEKTALSQVFALDPGDLVSMESATVSSSLQQLLAFAKQTYITTNDLAALIVS